ncbi:hypothetical protein FO519_010084, partial [Halicephalobus sp. NKZ332]
SGNSQCISGLCFCPPNHVLYKGFCQSPHQVKKLQLLELNNSTVTRQTLPPRLIPGFTKKPDPKSDEDQEENELNRLFPEFSTSTTTSSSLVGDKSEENNAKKPNTSEKNSGDSNPKKPGSSISNSIEDKFGNSFLKSSTSSPSNSIDDNVIGNSFLKGLSKLLPHLISNTNNEEEDFISPSISIIPHSLIKISKPGEYCDDELVYCSNGSLCVRNQCECAPNFFFANGFCVKPPSLFSFETRCFSSNQCASGAECISGYCKCPVDTIVSRFGFCIRLVKVPPGLSCSEGEICEGGSSCSDGICSCPAERPIIFAGSCIPESDTNKITNENPLKSKRRRRNSVIEFDSTSTSSPRSRRPFKFHQNLVQVPKNVNKNQEFENNLKINYEPPAEAQFQPGLIPLGAPCYQMASGCP